MNILLENGQRGLLVGQTGSGKTSNAIWQLQHTCSLPVIIFDTKFEDAFLSLADDNDKMLIVESVDGLNNLSKLKKEQLPSYILVRPHLDELMDLNLLDQYAELVYNKFGRCFIYIDELTSWHTPGGSPTRGIVALYTRGRSRGKTLLGSTQRPARISRFCISESQKFYVHWLGDQRDRKILGEVIPGYDRISPPPKYYFHHYEAGELNAPLLFKPVPILQKCNNQKKMTTMWI